MDPVPEDAGSPPAMPAGWYDDPFTDHLQRYWTGESWTKETRPLPSTVEAAPAAVSESPGPAGPGAPAWHPENATPGEAPIRDYLIPSIVVLIFCFWPLAIPALYFSLKANRAKRDGDLVAARERSERARLFVMLSVVAGVIVLAYLIWDAWSSGAFSA